MSAPAPTPPTPELASREALDNLLASEAAKGVLPALFMAVTNAEGDLYINQTGDRVFGQPDKGPVTEDTPVELFSQTKLLTSAAMLQLVEAGKIGLDDAADIARVLPELATCKLLAGYDDAGAGILVDNKVPITLRMLLTHTSGLVYAFLESPAFQYFQENPVSQFNCELEGLTTPLIFPPGGAFAYSHATDWVGLAIERLTGSSLEAYFQTHFFAPLGITSLTFYPTPAVAATKMAVCTRVPPRGEGAVHAIPGGWGMGRATRPEDVKLLHGGAGLMGAQKDYLKFLRGVLASDPRRGNAHPLLSPAVYKQLFAPALPAPGEGPHRALMAQFLTAWMPDAAEGGEFTPDNLSHSLGLGLNLADAPGRRKAGSGFWGGVAKTAYWIDPESGVAGIVGTNLLVPGRDGVEPWQSVIYQFERTVYASLEVPQVKAGL